MRRTCRQDFRGLAVVFGLALLGFVPARAQSSGKVASGRFQLSADGMTVHDDVLHVTWLVDANRPAKEKFGLPVRESGAMTYGRTLLQPPARAARCAARRAGREGA